MPNPLKFVEQKNQQGELVICLKNWQRKIEIAEVAAKKARAVVRMSGGYIDEQEMEELGY